MNIDYDAYTKLDKKVLEKIISHSKNILNLREQKTIQALETRDLDALKLSLQYNDSQTLSQDAWKTMNFHDLSYKQLDFFLFCTTLPKYNDNDQSLYGNSSKTVQAIESSFTDIKLFEYFINDSSYANIIKSIAKEKAVHRDVPVEIIDLIYKKNIINFDKDFLFTIAKAGNNNYLSYFLDKNIISLEKEDYKKLYELGWHHCDDQLLDRIKSNYPDYYKTSLADIISSISYVFQYNDKYDQFKYFTKIQSQNFFRTLRDHTFTNEDVSLIVKVFNNLAPERNEKFKNFVVFLAEEKPEFLSAIEESKNMATSGHFKKFYQSTLSYVHLNINLEEKENTTKKMKL